MKLNRRNFITLFSITALSTLVSTKAFTQVNTGKRVKKFNRGSKQIVIEEGGELDLNHEVLVKINKRTIKLGKQKSSNILKPNQTVYTSHYFPFGNEFNSPEELIDEIINSGQMSL